MKNFAALTHAGKVRSSNEDCITAAPDIGLWLVADGVGGHSHGEVASRIACEHTEAGVRNGQSLTQSIEASHRAIIEEISQKPYAVGSQARMGTTVVALHRVDANRQQHLRITPLAWPAAAQRDRGERQQ